MKFFKVTRHTAHVTRHSSHVTRHTFFTLHPACCTSLLKSLKAQPNVFVLGTRGHDGTWLSASSSSSSSSSPSSQQLPHVNHAICMREGWQLHVPSPAHPPPQPPLGDCFPHHSSTAHPSITALVASPSFACTICSMSFPSRNRLHIHLRTHDPSPPSSTSNLCPRISNVITRAYPLPSPQNLFNAPTPTPPSPPSRMHVHRTSPLPPHPHRRHLPRPSPAPSGATITATCHIACFHPTVAHHRTRTHSVQALPLTLAPSPAFTSSASDSPASTSLASTQRLQRAVAAAHDPPLPLPFDRDSWSRATRLLLQLLRANAATFDVRAEDDAAADADDCASSTIGNCISNAMDGKGSAAAGNQEAATAAAATAVAACGHAADDDRDVHTRKLRVCLTQAAVAALESGDQAVHHRLDKRVRAVIMHRSSSCSSSNGHDSVLVASVTCDEQVAPQLQLQYSAC